MFLNRTHVYEFIKQKWNINKTEIAKRLYFSSGNISPSRKYDEERLFNCFFNIGKADEADEADEAANAVIEKDILNELKDFIKREQIENNLESIWEAEYETFVREILRLANNDSTSKKTKEKNTIKNYTGSTSTELTPLEHIKQLFLQLTETQEFRCFVESEPIEEYLAKSNDDADVMRKWYLERKRQTELAFQSQFGAYIPISYRDEVETETTMRLNYSARQLKVESLRKSERLVSEITEKICVELMNYEDEGVYRKIDDFRRMLKKYNEYLRERLRPNGDCFIYKCDVPQFLQNSKAEYVRKLTVEFHMATRNYRAELDELYDEIASDGQDEQDLGHRHI